MIQEIQKGEELNEKNLKQFLVDHYLMDTVHSELIVRQFTNGYSNLTYQLDVENKTYVLRRPPHGAIKRGHDMRREYKVLSGLNSVFSKTPKVYSYTEDKTIIGASFYIMKKIDGVILTAKEADKRKISKEGYQKISDRWLDAFVELHKIDYKNCGLEDLGRPDGYVDRQVFNWGKQYLKASTQKVDEADKVMSWMENNKPKTTDFCLIHNDFKYDNIIFKDDSWNEILSILDWEMCTIGDPLMDLGTSLAYWFVASDPQELSIGIPSPTIYLGNPSRSEIIEMYASRSGRNIDNEVFYYVYGLFKIAVIAQQIFYRYNHGLTLNKKFAHLDKSSRFLCVMAWNAIQKNRIEDLF